MATEVRLGKLTPTMETGTITRWLKKEGDKVSSGDTIVEVETDKATMPLEVFEDGTLLKVLVKEGETVPLNGLVAIVGEPGEKVEEGKAAEVKPEAAKKPFEQIAQEPQKKPVSVRAKQQAGSAVAEPPKEAATAVKEPPAEPVDGGRIKASPLAKKIANERGVDLRQIKPSGPGGRIVQRDIPEESRTEESSARLENAAEGDKDVPLSNVRQTIARRLTQSKQTVPHWYVFSEINMERAMALRKELNALAEKDGIKISVNDLVVKIAAAALSRHPEINAAFNQKSIRHYGSVNIAIAVATDDGLYTPVLRHVERLSLGDISMAVKSLTQRTREKKLKPEDLRGSGFTISNLGMFGVDHFFAIINPPEAAILAVGAVKPKPLVNSKGEVVAGQMMGLTLSCDHRVVDGAMGAKFMGTLKDLLEHPQKLLL